MIHVLRIFLASAALVTAVAAPVQATAPTPASGQIWSQNQRVTYRWHDGNEPPSWMKTAINAAATDSNQSRASKAAVLVPDSNGASWIAYTSDMPTNWAIGYTISANIPYSFNMRLRPQGYPLDWGRLRWCQFYDSPPDGCYDAETIALHELGHAQTLSHADDKAVDNWTDTVMHWAPKTKPKAGWNQHSFGNCDVARLQIRYQPLDSSTRYSRCLNLATQLTLSSSATNVSNGSSVALTTRLKVDDGTMWPNLASQPLSDRTVVLQRRPLSGGSWTNLGSMSVADYNGRYSRGLKVTASFDYRVIFGAPSDEGLTGSTSAVVRIIARTIGSGCSSTDADELFWTC